MHLKLFWCNNGFSCLVNPNIFITYILHPYMADSRSLYSSLSPFPKLPSLLISVWGKKQIPFTRQISLKRDKLHCYQKPAHIKGSREEGVLLWIYQQKLIIHCKWNERTRGFSAADQWSNLKEFMSGGSACMHTVHDLYTREDKRIKRLRKFSKRSSLQRLNSHRGGGSGLALKYSVEILMY